MKLKIYPMNLEIEYEQSEDKNKEIDSIMKSFQNSYPKMLPENTIIEFFPIK